MGNSSSSKYHQILNYKLLTKEGYYINSDISSTKGHSVIIFYNHGDQNPESLNQLEFETISVDKKSEKIDPSKSYLGVIVWFTKGSCIIQVGTCFSAKFDLPDFFSGFDT